MSSRDTGHAYVFSKVNTELGNIHSDYWSQGVVMAKRKNLDDPGL